MPVQWMLASLIAKTPCLRFDWLAGAVARLENHDSDWWKSKPTHQHRAFIVGQGVNGSTGYDACVEGLCDNRFLFSFVRQLRCDEESFTRVNGG